MDTDFENATPRWKGKEHVSSKYLQNEPFHSEGGQIRPVPLHPSLSSTQNPRQPTPPPSYHSGTEGSLETVWEGSDEKIVCVHEQPKTETIARAGPQILAEALEKKIFENSERIRITLDQTTQGMQNRIGELHTGVAQKLIRDDEKNSRRFEEVHKKFRHARGTWRAIWQTFRWGLLKI